MSNRSGFMRTALIALAALAATTGAAFAQSADQLRASGLFGEQLDGYLGVRTGAAPSAQQRAMMDSINIQRRDAYTRTAAESGVRVIDVATTAVCDTYRNRIDAGEWYQIDGGAWAQRQGQSAVPLPSVCP